MIDQHCGGAADIMRYADMALYRAKNEGRNRACIYDAAMDADLSQRKLLEGDLREAIENDELAAALPADRQRQRRDRRRRRGAGRWTHPTRGEIPPSEFIPIAEHCGLIIELGELGAAPRLPRRHGMAGSDGRGQRLAAAVPPRSTSSTWSSAS